MAGVGSEARKIFSVLICASILARERAFQAMRM